jgi:predicted RecA/RadA family phage recombinase
MLTTYKHRGEALDFVNSGDAVIKAGEVRVIGSRIGVIGDDIAPGAVGSIEVEGVFEFPLSASTAVAQGDAVYWDAENKKITNTSSGNTAAGYAAAAAVATDEVITVKIG